MKKYLIFGGAGFIGRNYCDMLLKESGTSIVVFDNLSMGNQIQEIQNDLRLIQGEMTDQLQVSEVVARERPDVVIHLAANSDISAAAKNPLLDVRNTFESTVSLANAILTAPVPEVIFASSSAIYGQVAGPITDKTIPKPESSYGWMKLASEKVLEKCVEIGALESLLVTRFPNVTGRWQTHGVVFDLCRKLINADKELVVLGDGSQLKPYANPEELVAKIHQISSLERKGTTSVLLAPNDQASVSEIATELTRIFQKDVAIKYGNARSGWLGDVPEYSFDCSFTESLVGPLNFKSSKKAIIDSATWEFSRLFEKS